MALFDFLNKPKSILEGITRSSGLDFLLKDLKKYIPLTSEYQKKVGETWSPVKQYGAKVIERAKTPYPQLVKQREQEAQKQPWYQSSLMQGARMATSTIPPLFSKTAAYQQKIKPFLEEKTIGKFPTGKMATSMLEEAPEMEGIRQKLKFGETLTPEEKKIVRQEQAFVVADIALTGPKKAPKMPSKWGKALSQEKYAFNINVERMKTTKGGEKILRETVEKIKPELERIKGKTLTHEEVLEEANRASMIKQVVSRKAQKESEAALLKLRQNTTSISNQLDKLGKNASPELWKDYIQNLKVLSSQNTEKGRALEALKIGAEDVPVREKFLQEIIDITDKTDEIVEAAKKVDFNNATEATKFYRKFIKPSKTEMLEWFRFNNMLSSPKTWIVNIVGNLLQFPLSTTEKLVSGGVDFVASALKPGRQRKYYVREVPHYVKGFLSGIPDAIKGFTDALTGKKLITRPDVKRVSPFTAKPAKLFEAGTRIMEAGDMFFRGLFDAANTEALAYKYKRMGKEIAPEVLTKQAQKETLTRLFRQPLKEAGQGKLLTWIDDLTSGVYKLRKVPLLGWVVPFIQTPMNILKQGIEYSPMGFATIPGAAEKIPQLSKSLIGSAVFLGAMQLALEDRVAGKAPRGEKEKQAFYDSGRKQYSILIGNHWVSISKLGPVAYPIALAILAKEAFEENPSDSAMANLGRTLLGQLEFFSEQSYLEGINNALQVARGEEYAAKQFIASMAGQVVPERAFLAWASRIIDDVYRKPKTLAEMMKSQLPFLSKEAEPYKGLAGKPSKRPYPVLSALSPFDISPAVPRFEPFYQEKKEVRISKKEERKREEEEEKKWGGAPSMFRPKTRKGSPTRERRPFIMR